MLFMLMSLAGSILLVGCSLWLASRKYRHYPGLGIPVFGDLYQAATSYTSSLLKLVIQVDAGFDRYGDTYCRRLGPIVVILTADPHLIQELAMHPFMADKEPLIYGNFRPFFKGAFSSAYADKKWKHDRKLVLDTMKKNYLEEYHHVFVRKSLEMVKALEKRSGELDVLPLVMLMALDVSADALGSYQTTYLRDEDFSTYAEFERLNNEITALLLSLGFRNIDKNYIMSYKHLWKLNEQVFEQIMEKIEQRNRNAEFELGTMPLLEYITRDLLEAGATKEDVKPYIIESFSESFYTTGIVLSGALLFLGIYQEVQEKAWAEQKEILAESSECPTLAGVKKMAYLERVVREATRLVGVPFLPRRSSGNIKIGDHFIPENSTLIYSFDRIRKDPRYWKTPNQFNPDHFLPDEVASRPKGAYLAFGSGIRNCPGFQYGINFCKVALSIIIRKFRITSPLKATDLEFDASLFMVLKGPHTICIEPRNL